MKIELYFKKEHFHNLEGFLYIPNSVWCHSIPSHTSLLPKLAARLCIEMYYVIRDNKSFLKCKIKLLNPSFLFTIVPLIRIQPITMHYVLKRGVQTVTMCVNVISKLHIGPVVSEFPLNFDVTHSSPLSLLSPIQF